MLSDLLAPLAGLLPAGDHAVLRAQRSTARSVTLLGGDVVGNARSQSAGVSARVCRGGVYGFAAVAGLDRAAAETALREAEDNAAFLDRHVPRHKPPLAALAPAPIPAPRPWQDAEQGRYLDYLRALDAYLAPMPGLLSRKLAFRADSMEKRLLLSDGSQAHTAIPRCYVYVTLTGEGPDGPVERFRAFGGLGGMDDWFTDPALLYPSLDDLAEQLRRKREGVYPLAGRKTCILGGELSGMLAHEAVGHTVEADLVLGGSVAARYLGRQAASPLVSMTDFAHTAFGREAPLPVYCDDEGTPAVDAPLIRDGVLVGYLNSRETAARFQMPPQGSARAFGYADEPLIRMRNTAIHPGKNSLADMIASVEDGYYFLDTDNGQADTNGEFMFGVTMGYEIKKGKLGRALLDATISGVAFEMLKTVDMVSGDVVWASSGFCGKKQLMPVGVGGPALRCKVQVGGR